MKRLLLLASCLALVSCKMQRFPDDILLLDKELSQREIYDNAFQKRVQALSVALSWTKDPQQLYKANRQLADEYSHNCFDSAQVYYLRNLSLAAKLNDPVKITETKLAIAQNYVYGGYFKEADDILRSVDSLTLDDRFKKEYYYSWMILSRNLRTHAPNANNFDSNRKRFEAYMEQLRPYAEPGSFLSSYLEWEDSRNRNDAQAGPELAEKMVRCAEEGTCNYSEACFYASLSYLDLKMEEPALKYLCLSAINDIRISKKDDNRAAATISQKLLGSREGAEKAFLYITEIAFRNSLMFKGKRDLDRLSDVMMQVEKEYRRYSDSTHRLLIFCLVIVFLFAAVMAVGMRVFHINNKKLKKTQKKLSEANKVKEEYITSFIEEIADSGTKSRRYYNHVLQMVRKGKSEELVKEIENIPDEDTDIENFNRMFDSTFLGIYPDFVDKFNSLLREGEQILPKEEGSLCPELRIYALSKLGIKDLKKVASLLKYSQTTIYNYRTKVKSKAINPNSDFDSLVSKL